MNKKHAALLLSAVFMVAFGFNTIDQMMIRYKFYDDWRPLDSWEMSFFWSPHWWLIYILSLAMFGVGWGIIFYFIARFEHVPKRQDTRKD